MVKEVCNLEHNQICVIAKDSKQKIGNLFTRLIKKSSRLGNYNYQIDPHQISFISNIKIIQISYQQPLKNPYERRPKLNQHQISSRIHTKYRRDNHQRCNKFG